MTGDGYCQNRRNNTHRENGKDRKKTEITLSNVCSSGQSLCAKWCGRVFKNGFLRHAHTTYHVTALLQTSERKNNGLESLNNKVTLSRRTEM